MRSVLAAFIVTLAAFFPAQAHAEPPMRPVLLWPGPPAMLLLMPDATTTSVMFADTPRPLLAPGVPALFHISGEGSDISVSLSPGSPCTAACLKLAGSF